jgi:hypothetical protein
MIMFCLTIQWAAEADVSRRLLQPYLGPFKVLSKTADFDNYTLALPPTLRCHPVFHVSLLRKWISPHTHFPDRHISATNPLPTILADGDHYEVQDILQFRYRGPKTRRTKQYLVRWKGYDRSHDSWEPLEYLSTCPEILSAFNARGILKSQVKDNLSGGTVVTRRLRPRRSQGG